MEASSQMLLAIVDASDPAEQLPGLYKGGKLNPRSKAAAWRIAWFALANWDLFIRESDKELAALRRAARERLLGGMNT